jgi:hypothetical protein
VKDSRAERLPEALSATEAKRKIVAYRIENRFRRESRKEREMKQEVICFKLLDDKVDASRGERRVN